MTTALIAAGIYAGLNLLAVYAGCRWCTGRRA
ncbi:hypothetical protein ABIB07_001802 [Bradyrhizobium sp. RT10b]